MSDNPRNSAAVIAKLLGTEGYSDYTHNQVTRYWRRKIMDRRQEDKIDRIEAEFSALMAERTEAEKLLIGRFISLRSKMSFDTGLRVGMQAFAHVGRHIEQPIGDHK